jgi:serine/threonine protein kinase
MSPHLSPSFEELTAGRELGPYRLLRSLGSGGMARVFLAEHRHLGHVRAIKVLPPEPSDARAALTMRLMTEARAMARLRHPSVVEVFDCDTLPSAGAFIAMEYLQGEPAGDWLQRIGPLEKHPRLAAAVIGTVADALAYAHQQGVIHRDVKPDNLFIIPDPVEQRRFSLKVLDFGIAKIVQEKPLVKTQVGVVVGTPFYLAPEGWEPGAAVDQRTDIYSLGCVFFELLCGRRPFAGEDALQIMRAHLVDRPPGVRTLAPGVPQELADLIARMLEKAPQDRPETMEAVVASLEAFLELDRSHFRELLQLPEHSPSTSCPCLRTAPTSLGLGVVMEPVVTSTTEVPRAEQPHPWRRRSMFAAAAVLVVLGGALLMGGDTSAKRTESARHELTGPTEHNPQPATTRPQVSDPPVLLAPPMSLPEVSAVPREGTGLPLESRSSQVRPARERTVAIPVRRPPNDYRPIGD